MIEGKVIFKLWHLKYQLMSLSLSELMPLVNIYPLVYVFTGKKWMDELMEDAPPGSVGTMSEKSWSNSIVFETYLTNYLAKHVAYQREQTERLP